MRDLKGRVAVITGAATGMGRELAIQLAHEGTHLALCDVNMTALNTTAQTCRNFDVTVCIHKVDVSKREDVKRFAADVAAHFDNKINLLFNNAGVASSGPFDTMSKENFDWCLNINLNGVIMCTRFFLPYLKEQDKAYIINTSSVAGYYPSTFTGVPYTTSKFAVRGFTESLLAEARAYYPNVNVACVHPGIIKTDIIDNSRATLDSRVKTVFGKIEAKNDNEIIAKGKEQANTFYSKFGYTAEEASRMILNGVKSGRTRIRVGWDAVIFDWWIRLFPRIFISKFNILVTITAILLRRFYFPSFGFIILVWLFRRFRSL